MFKPNILTLLVAITFCSCNSVESDMANRALKQQDSLAIANQHQLALEMKADSLLAREEIESMNRQFLTERLGELQSQLNNALAELKASNTKLARPGKNSRTEVIKTIGDLKVQIREIEKELN